jgi:dihydroorotate dehydrogenase (NAD+) catalytic subunit
LGEDRCKKTGLDFITAHNGPGGIVIDVENQVPFGAPSIGGYVMGRAFLPYSLARVVRIRKATHIPIIGVGGIYNASDALQYLLCDCPLVGIGSAIYFQGPEILDRIHKGLSDWMTRKGYLSIIDFKGKVLPLIEDSQSLRVREKYPFTIPPECPYIPVIDDKACNFCGTCQSACIYNVFQIDKTESRISVNENRCWSCGFCVGVCPESAIELRERHDREKVIWKNQGMAEPFKK